MEARAVVVIAPVAALALACALGFARITGISIECGRSEGQEELTRYLAGWEKRGAILESVLL